MRMLFYLFKDVWIKNQKKTFHVKFDNLFTVIPKFFWHHENISEDDASMKKEKKRFASTDSNLQLQFLGGGPGGLGGFEARLSSWVGDAGGV